MYEVAGASHFASPLNPLEHDMVARAVFVGGDRWIRNGTPLPPSHTLAADASSADDLVYGRPTGILRDADGNARGGVRLPKVEIDVAQYVAADFSFDPFPPLGLFGLVGRVVDLACAPRAGEDEPRFGSHGAYMRSYVHQANALVAEGLLLTADADRIKEAAGASEVGTPGSCGA